MAPALYSIDLSSEFTCSSCFYHFDKRIGPLPCRFQAPLLLLQRPSLPRSSVFVYKGRKEFDNEFHSAHHGLCSIIPFLFQAPSYCLTNASRCHTFRQPFLGRESSSPHKWLHEWHRRPFALEENSSRKTNAARANSVQLS